MKPNHPIDLLNVNVKKVPNIYIRIHENLLNYKHFMANFWKETFKIYVHYDIIPKHNIKVLWPPSRLDKKFNQI